MEIAIGTMLPYVAFIFFAIGTLVRIACWMRIPVPFHLTLFPAQKGECVRARELALEFFLCRSLYREDRMLWLWVWLFHLSIFLVVCGHVLGIYFLRLQFTLVGLGPDLSRTLSIILGGFTGVVMTFSLVALLVRRILSREIRRLSDPGIFFDLILLLAIAVTGIAMYLPGYHVDLNEVRSYAAGLFRLDPPPLPHGPVFFAHFLLVNLLMVYFPFSRMLHSAGFFINRGMLAEIPPVYPTAAQIRPRSEFAVRKIHPDIPHTMKHLEGREVDFR